jgi:hypothetical protein
MVEMTAIESELATSTYAEVADRLEDFSDEDLFALLDSSSIRVGDTAADILIRRNRHDLAIDGILNRKIKTANGRLRAMSMLSCLGKSVPMAELVYLDLLEDKSARVVDNALFGLVFWQNKENIPKIEAAMAKAKPRSKKMVFFEQAIEALRKDDPFLFSPHFADPNNVWELGPRGRNGLE